MRYYYFVIMMPDGSEYNYTLNAPPMDEIEIVKCLTQKKWLRVSGRGRGTTIINMEQAIRVIVTY